MIDHYQARKDFGEICEVFKGFKSDSAEESGDLDRSMRRSRNIFKVIDSNAAFKTMQALAHADHKQKYQLFLDAAKEVGLKGFSCPPFQEFHSSEHFVPNTKPSP
ncbi:hypothetical protein OAQ84_01595 [Bdellovibrionales bacterium]|nr:hypothetical protein [Bdellovibrionales bacterium]